MTWSEAEFMEMTDSVVAFLQRSGLNAEPRDRPNARLSAFRRNIYFPQLLFDLQLSGHKEERFLLKIEAQNQGVPYEPRSVNVQGCGFYFPLPVPPDEILLSMKLSALLSRAKGRDFYDTMFLMSQTTPDYAFLKARARNRYTPRAEASHPRDVAHHRPQKEKTRLRAPPLQQERSRENPPLL